MRRTERDEKKKRDVEWEVRWVEVRRGEERSAWREYNWLCEADIWAADGATLRLRWPREAPLSVSHVCLSSVHTFCIYNEQHWPNSRSYLPTALPLFPFIHSHQYSYRTSSQSTSTATYVFFCFLVSAPFSCRYIHNHNSTQAQHKYLILCNRYKSIKIFIQDVVYHRHTTLTEVSSIGGSLLHCMFLLYFSEYQD